MRPVKIEIRLRECAVWSQSSLGAHVRFYADVAAHKTVEQANKKVQNSVGCI